MPNAIIASTAFAGNGTQTFFLNQLNAAMLAAGFTLIDAYAVTTNEFYVWEYNEPSDPLDGKMIVEGGFTAAATFRVRGFRTFDPETDSGTNPTTTAGQALTSLASTFVLHSCNHPEIRGVIIVEAGTIRKFLGYMRPANKPLLWSGAPYGFIERSATAAYDSSLLQTISATRPAAVGANCSSAGMTNNGGFSLELWGNKPLVTNAGVGDATNGRMISIFSNDVISLGTGGAAILNEVYNPANNAIYKIFDNPSTTVPRLAIKVG